MPERQRRNVRPKIGSARAKLGGLTARGAAPEDIAAARAALAAAKAEAAVRELLCLPAADRVRLAGMLLTGDRNAPA